MSMRDEERRFIIEILQSGKMLSPDWAEVLFPAQKRESELIYAGKVREADILAETMAVPLQPSRLFGNNGDDWHNMLIFGDNLQAMKSLLDMKKRGELRNADGTPGIRLVYIDPPFSTKREMQGQDGVLAYQDKVAAAEFLEFIRKRLILIRELLSDDGSVYVHLDWRMNSYVRVLMDEVFGKENFLNEIVWCYREREIAKDRFNAKHDTIFFYAKNSLNKERVFNCYEIALPYSKGSQAKYSLTDSDGRKYQIRGKGGAFTGKQQLPPNLEKSHPDLVYRDYWDEKKGVLPRDWFDDISFENRASSARTGYPTQKPEALLERIINASSNKGDLVADFFAGSGTTPAVAEKLGRRWVASDCGKLAIYTMQKRMLNLRRGIGNKGASLKARPFALYNAGLYDIEKLNERPEDWRRFALQLFQCKDELHKIGGIQMDGKRRGKSVMVFPPHEDDGAWVTEETVQSIHRAVKGKAGDCVFLIAPAMRFGFFQDYIDLDDVRYYALRIPYSIIHELHRRDFAALRQPTDVMAVNDTVDAVGFDFIMRPGLKYATGKKQGRAFIKITTFKSEAGGLEERENLDTLSMLMLDYDYNPEKRVFELDEVFYAAALDKNKSGWTATFSADNLGRKVMAIFVDIYGNEARELISAKKFRSGGPGGAQKKSATKKRAGKKR